MSSINRARGVREGGTGGSMDPPVDVPATPTRCIFCQFSRVILGRRRRVGGGGNYEKKKEEKRRTKKVNMFDWLFCQIVGV